EEVAGAKFKIANDSVVVSSKEDAKFGTFDETDMSTFIQAYKTDFEEFLTLGQCPPELAGLAANLAADAMEGARRSSYQKLSDLKRLRGRSSKSPTTLWWCRLRKTPSSARLTRQTCLRSSKRTRRISRSS